MKRSKWPDSEFARVLNEQIEHYEAEKQLAARQLAIANARVDAARNIWAAAYHAMTKDEDDAER